MKYFFALVLFIFASQCSADGPTTTHGINAAGELITVDEEEFDYGPEGVDWGPNAYNTVRVVKNGKQIKSYKKQLCGFDPRGEKMTFSCAKNGKSPLAGATYMYVKELSACKGTLFICKEGCGAGAPRKLISDPWECDRY